MKTNKLLLSFLLAILLVSTVSALDLCTQKSFKNDKPKFGTVEVYNGWWCFGDKKGDYNLVDYSQQCLTDCWAEFNVTLYKDEQIFTDMKFKDVKGDYVNKDYKVMIQEVEDYTIPNPIYNETCTTVTNGTNSSQVCTNQLIRTDYTPAQRTVWKNYNGETKVSGNYYVRIEGKKGAKENIDFIPVAFQTELSEFAWWNSSWSSKRLINITNTGNLNRQQPFYNQIITGLSVTNCSNEIRILNEAEDTEIASSSEDINSTACKVSFIYNITSTEATKAYYIYYGNPTATAPNYENVGFTYNGTTLNNFNYNLTLGTTSTGSDNCYDQVANLKSNFWNLNATSSKGACYVTTSTATWDNLWNALKSKKVLTSNNSVYKKVQYNWTSGLGETVSYNITFFRGLDYWLIEDIKGMAYPNASGFGTNMGGTIVILGYRNATGGYTSTTNGAPSTQTVYNYFDFSKTGDTKGFFVYMNNGSNGLSTQGYIRTGNGVDPQFSTGGWNYVRMNITQFSGNYYSGFNGLTTADRDNMYNSLSNAVTYTVSSEISGASMTLTNDQPPTNTLNTTSRTVTFGCNATATGGNVTEIVLNVTGQATFTQTTGALNTPSYNATFTNTTMANGAYTWNCIAYGNVANASSSLWYYNVSIPYPTWKFNYQIPADLSTLNSIVTGMNISYNWSTYPNVNASTVYLYYKSNSSTSNIQYYQNGTGQAGYFRQAYNSNSTNESYLWNLYDNSYLPGTYNYGEMTIENTAHKMNTLATANNMIMIELQNVSNVTAYGFFEVMANKSVSAGASANEYVCNTSYSTGNPATNANCYLFNVINANVSYNHCHPGTGGSCHQVDSFVPNITTGTIGGIKITSTMYFIVQGSSGGTWSYGYIDGTARAGAFKTSSNTGGAWTINNTIIVDSHLHQFDPTTTFYYYSTANSTYDITQMNTTDVRSDLMEQGGLPPSAPLITAPINGYYKTPISIAWNPSQSPNGYAISNYTIYLYNSDHTLNTTLVVLNGNNATYSWATGSQADGVYVIGIKATDNNSLVSPISFSDNFTLDNTAPRISIVYPLSQNYSSYVTSLNWTVSGADNCWYSLDNGATNTSITCGQNVTLSATEGTFNYKVYANDTAGNFNSSSVSYTVNITRIYLQSPTDNYTSYYNPVPLVCNAVANPPTTLSNISLWTNVSGSWARTQISKYVAGYDYTNDSSLNASLWNNYSTGTGTSIAETNVITGQTSVNCQGCGGAQYLDSTNFDTNLTSSFIINVQLYAIADGGVASGTATLSVFGNTIKTITKSGSGGANVDDSNWTFIVNGSSWSVYNDGVYDSTISKLNNNISFTASAGGGASQTNSGTGRFILRGIVKTQSGSYNQSFSQTIQNSTLWGCEVCDSNNNCYFASENRTVDILHTAPTITIAYPSGNIQSLTPGVNISLNYSIVSPSISSCWYNYNGTNVSTSCTANSSFIYENGVNTLTMYANDTIGNVGTVTTVWYAVANENGAIYNATTYETARESFVLNMTLNASSYPSATGNLIYNGVSYPSTVTTSNGNVLFSNSLDIPASAGVKSFYWQMQLNATVELNSTTRTQTVSPLIFGLCNSTNNVVYINITFKNETIAKENVSALIASTIFNYSIGGSITKSYSYSNPSSNPSYAFCFSPNNLTINVFGTISYSNAESQSRTFIITNAYFTNTPTYYTLYLLPTSLGYLSHYKTVSTTNSIVPSVYYTVALSGTNNIVSSGYTDTAGLTAIWLNPTTNYDYVFSKPGYPTNTFTLAPNSADTYTITMGAASSIPNGTTINNNLTTVINPNNQTLINDTSYNFVFTVTGNSHVTAIYMNLTNSSGSQIFYGSNAGLGTVSTIINTGSNNQIVGKFKIVTDQGETITYNRVWTIGNYFIGDYSLYNQLGLFTKLGFPDWVRIAIALGIIIVIMIYLSTNEMLDTSESKVAVMILLIWAFSLIGWLNTGISTSTNALAHLANQYGIAIITTAGGIFFIWRRIV